MSQRLVGRHLLARDYDHGMDEIDRLVDLQRALEGLKGHQLLALELRRQGWRNQDIAPVFGMTRQGVQAVIASAVKRLRQAMA